MYGDINTLDFLIQNFSGKNPPNVAFPAAKAATSDGTSGNYFSSGNPTNMRVTQTDSFIIGGWINASAIPDISTIITKGSVAGQTDDYALYIQNGTNKLTFSITGRGIGHTELASTQAISTGVTTFILAYYDGNGTLFCQVNNNAPTSKALSLTMGADIGNNVAIMADNNGGLTFAGTVDELFFCKNPSSLTNALNAINTTIYNSGTGRRIYTVDANTRNTMGLISWWGMDEASGASRKDLYDGNTLTLHGTITQANPLIS